MNFRKGYLLVLPAALVLFFQNCAENVQFSKDLSSSSMSAMDSISQQTLFYTNTNYVKIKVNIDSVWFTKCRASIYQDMDAKGVAWQSCGKTQELLVYLNEEYASGGAKDGPKTIYVEASDETAGQKENAPKISARVTAFLDTLVPEIEGLDILKKGLAGATFKKDQSVTLNWTAEDKAAATKESSGIDPVKGIRWAITKNGSCEDASITNVSDWTNGDVRKTDLKWPAADPLETFYVCIYAQDRAGNRGYFLSQPLTSLWTVIAGDNSVGDGASVTAPQVRVKSPYNLSVDPEGHIHFVDSLLGIYRMIKNPRVDSSRVIQSSSLPLFSGNVVFDSQGYGYLVNTGVLYQLGLDRKTLKRIAPLASSSDRAIRKYKDVESLLVVTRDGYLYEVPLSVIKSIPDAGLTSADFKMKYRVVGTGVIPKTSSAISETLSKQDPASDETKALGYIYSVSTDEDGTIYVSTCTDGVGAGMGHHAVRALTQQADGSFQQLVLSGEAWVVDASYAKRYEGTKKHEYLLLATAYKATAIDLTKWKESKSTSGITIPTLKTGYFTSVLAQYFPDKKDFEFLVGSSSESKIFHYDGQFNLLESLGRDVYEKSKEGTEQDALKMVLGHPGGLFTAPGTSDVFVHDNQNSVVFRIDTNGNAKKVAGTHVFSSSFLNGYVQRLTGDFSAGQKVLYYGNKVVDLNSNTEKVLYPTSLANGYSWYNSSLAFVPGVGGKNSIYNVRHFNVVSKENWHVSMTGLIHKVDLTGYDQADAHSTYLGDVMQGAQDSTIEPARVVDNSAINLNFKGNYLIQKAAVDSQKYMFVSGGAFLINKLDEAKSYVLRKPKVAAGFAVVEQGNLRYIFYPSTPRISYIVIDMSKISPTANEDDFVSNAKVLCLPGTSLRSVWDIAVSKSGDLVLADSDNARVLLYRIRDKAGNLTFKEQGSTGCQN